MSAPDWLTSEYIELALRSFHKNENIQITAFKLKPALGKGENYGGVLTRLFIKYKWGGKGHEQHLIVKTSYEDDEFANTKMAPYDIYNREMSIYAEVLPQLNQLLHEINDEDQLFAIALHVDRERMAIVFEDLSADGYVMADRIKRLDLAHVQLILRKLAKMHAASAVLNERNNRCLEGYDRGFFNRYTDNYSAYFVGNIVACGEYLTTLPEYAYYGKKLLALAPHIMEIGKRCFAPTPGHINVLAHGDVWTNNVMFKYDCEGGQPIDVLLIDFQYTFWGSPHIDLHHLFNTSMLENIRMQGQDQLFRYYYDVFASTLRKLSYSENPIPSLHKFLVQAEQKRFFAVYSSFVAQPVMINEDPQDADFNALMGEDERSINFKNRLYRNPIVQQNIKQLLPHFDCAGLLEPNQCN